MKQVTPRLKALVSVALFVLSVLFSFAMFGITDWQVSWPLVAFYAILIVNSYFSIECFALVAPAGVRQNLMDTILAIELVVVPLFFNDPFKFEFFLLLVFVTAILKYTLLLGLTDHPNLVHRKITFDTLGAIACALSFLLIWIGRINIATIGWLVIFFVVNVYIFFIHPLYKLNYG